MVVPRVVAVWGCDDDVEQPIDDLGSVDMTPESTDDPQEVSPRCLSHRDITCENFERVPQLKGYVLRGVAAEGCIIASRLGYP